MAQTQEKSRSSTQVAAPQQAPGTNVALFQHRIAYNTRVKALFGIDRAGWGALIDAVCPSAKSLEGVILYLSYCKARGFDPFKRMAHIVPVWSSALGREIEGVWPGVGEHRATAARTGQYAGCDETVFGDNVTETFEGDRNFKQKDGTWKKEHIGPYTITYPSWARITVYKIVAGVRCPFPGPRVHFKATYGRNGKTDVPNDKWLRMPSYMLEKCSEAAALRKAFPEELGDEPTAEEMEGKIVDITPSAQPAQATPPQIEKPTRADFDGKPASPPPRIDPKSESEAGDAPDDADHQILLDNLIEELGYCQQVADVDEMLAYRAEDIGILPHHLTEKWDKALADKRASFMRNGR